MSFLLLLGAALLLLLGFSFVAVVTAAVTALTVQFVFKPVFRSMDKTWTQKGDYLTPTMLKLGIYATFAVVPAFFLLDYSPVVVGVYIGSYISFKRLAKEGLK